MSVKQQKNKKRKTKASKVTDSVTIPSGWNTTDEEEIQRRIQRAETEPMKVTSLEPEIPYFANYRVESKTASSYDVEIRSLRDPINSCSCVDYDINGLGTCKHIEKVLLTLKKKGKRRFQEASHRGSQRAEIYVDPLDHHVKITWPFETIQPPESYAFLKDFFSANGKLIADAKTTIPVLVRLLSHAPENIFKSIRLSHRLQTSLDDFDDFTLKMTAKDFFLQDVSEGKYTLDIAKMPLYDYQKQGMIHLAFLEKAILADEMGLGKTVQAIGAAELLRKLKGIRKVLVVAPTSLKAEWEEQITKFVNNPSVIVCGNRAERLRHYQKEAFFYITNYEQVVRDREDIQRLIAPDIVILDEAQRIKNWRTKTAATLKQLESPYAFLLTGTPIENRIDDIYSIVQFLYPKLFGSLFRFNRDFYQLDDHGKEIGYKNLDKLHERLKPFLLRRLKGDVEGQLPDRTINTYFVEMSTEQQSRYGEYEDCVARLAAAAKRRPLREEEFKKLQMALASMRMICDTPYILDQDCRVCPKLHELEPILEELFQDEQTKIIIFSEWERMLQLTGELLKKMNIEYAWHTGSVNQIQRRKEINRFKEENACRVFLSTDSGAVGLNLQVANVVVNLDLPWNPAKLEQRIARAWRKHQTRTVQVINLVSKDTIEHRMLAVLDLKKRLAESVLDLGTVQEMEMPTGRKAFMEQLGKILGSSCLTGPVSNSDKEAKPGEKKEEAQKDPLVLFQQEALARLKPRLHQLEVYKDHKGAQTIFAVVDGDLTHPRNQMQAMIQNLDPQHSLQLEVLDRASFQTIERLCKAGILSFHPEKATSLYRSSVAPSYEYEEQKRKLEKALSYRAPIERKQRMASLLIEDDFYEEAMPPLKDILFLSIKSFAVLTDYAIHEEKELSIEDLQNDLVMKKGFPKDAVSLALQFVDQKDLDKEKATKMLKTVRIICQFVNNFIDTFRLKCVA